MSLTPENSSAGWPNFGGHFNIRRNSNRDRMKVQGQVTSSAEILSRSSAISTTTLALRAFRSSSKPIAGTPAKPAGSYPETSRLSCGFCYLMPHRSGATDPSPMALRPLVALLILALGVEGLGSTGCICLIGKTLTGFAL